ncbi:hypothetical protein CEXT_446921 [Caerostris extrusa]|uniref:Uncharacterized protein n=1 Tax=Caerostris extrusa TaxID=172846 RepID=A0AAV4RWL9_CAEEX|nr:hypothetical protein CEXT_446921 [Caerostris extrusa]
MTVVRAFLSPSTVNRDVDSSFIRCINITLRAANCTSASFYLISFFAAAAAASVFFLGQDYPRIDRHQSNHRPSLTDAHLTKESGRSRGAAVSMHLPTSVVEEVMNSP